MCIHPDQRVIATRLTVLLLLFLAFNFCRFCVFVHFFSFPPQRSMPSDFEGFPIPDCIHYFYFPTWILEKEAVFPYLTRELPGTIIITSLVWRGPWLGIESGTSRTRCQHSTTRLSRRRYLIVDMGNFFSGKFLLFQIIRRVITVKTHIVFRL